MDSVDGRLGAVSAQVNNGSSRGRQPRYLGWQQSLNQLAQWVEAEIPDQGWRVASQEILRMGKVKVGAFSISIDGFGAGPGQSLENPLGVRGTELHQWFFKTRVFQQMHGGAGGVEDTDNAFAARSFENVGAWIMGRNMFGPIRGSWPDDEWRGWWGPNPPYHVPVYVLTHHPRAPLEMEGGTTFFFVNDGIESALKQARKVVKDKDVRIGGGVSVIRQFLSAGLIDEMHLVMSPVLLGSGEHLFAGLNFHQLGFKCAEHVGTASALHLVLKKES